MFQKVMFFQNTRFVHQQSWIFVSKIMIFYWKSRNCEVDWSRIYNGLHGIWKYGSNVCTIRSSSNMDRCQTPCYLHGNIGYNGTFSDFRLVNFVSLFADQNRKFHVSNFQRRFRDEFYLRMGLREIRWVKREMQYLWNWILFLINLLTRCEKTKWNLLDIDVYL